MKHTRITTIAATALLALGGTGVAVACDGQYPGGSAGQYPGGTSDDDATPATTAATARAAKARKARARARARAARS